MQKELFFFLHKMGYTYFDLAKLTYPEINMLIEVHNNHEKQKQHEIKKAARRRK